MPKNHFQDRASHLSAEHRQPELNPGSLKLSLAIRYILPRKMPPLQGFSDISFQSHIDLTTAVIALLGPLIQYQSTGGARIRFPIGTAAHFDEVAAELEGFARPLYVLVQSTIFSCDSKATILNC